MREKDIRIVEMNLRWKQMCIVMFPMFLLVIFILHQKPVPMLNDRLSGLFDSYGMFSREKGLLFIGPSTVTVNMNMTLDEADISFFKFISNLHLICEDALRFGNALDGGWDMCVTEAYIPKGPCLIYSFGINNDFSFDDAISRKFNCTVRCFDPSMSSGTHRRSDKIWFYKIGIGGKDTVDARGWTLKTFGSMIELLNETDKIIDYLKIDVEWSEWPSLGPMLANDTLSGVMQFGLEIHMDKQSSVKEYYDKYLILKQLEDLGFRRWYFARNYYALQRAKNGFRSLAYEMVYINTRFLRSSHRQKRRLK